jgi:hypothetical protein
MNRRVEILGFAYSSAASVCALLIHVMGLRWAVTVIPLSLQWLIALLILHLAVSFVMSLPSFTPGKALWRPVLVVTTARILVARWTVSLLGIYTTCLLCAAGLVGWLGNVGLMTGLLELGVTGLVLWNCVYMTWTWGLRPETIMPRHRVFASLSKVLLVSPAIGDIPRGRGRREPQNAKRGRSW